MSNILTAACNRATLARESAGRVMVDGRFVGIVLSLFTHTKKENPKMHPSVPILRFVSFRVRRPSLLRYECLINIYYKPL